MGRRGWIIAAVIVAVLALAGPLFAVITDSSKPEQQTPPLDLASAAAGRFLDGYVDANGKVKTDANIPQGQAQGWGLLIAAAAGDNARYASILGWTNANVASSERDKAIAFDVAWSMAAAATRLSNPDYAGQANAMANDVISTPSSNREGGVDNNIFFLGLYQLQNSVVRLPVRALIDNQRESLEVQMKGPEYSSLPLSTANNYSGDALNQPLNLVSSCEASDKTRATYIWTKLRESRDTRTATALAPDGKVVDKTQSVRAAVASAAAAQAAGEQLQAYALLTDADGIQKKHPTMEGAAWDALGRILTTTTWLGPCPSS